MPTLTAFREKWVWYMVLTVLFWGGWAILSKLVTEEIPENHAIFVFTLGAASVAVALLIHKRFRVESNPKGVFYGIANGVVSNTGNLAVFAAFVNDPGGHTSLIATVTGLYPLITVILAVCILRERLTGMQGIGLALVVIAIIIFSQSPEGTSGDVLAAAGSGQGTRTAPPWLLYAALAMLSFGLVGLLQKLSTNHLSADSALTWLTVGFLFFLPVFYPGRLILGYSGRSWVLAFLSGVSNMLGAWTLLAAMRSGGKASIIVPFTALYPAIVVLAAPLLFSEPILFHQSVAIVCALAATVLLSQEKPEDATA